MPEVAAALVAAVSDASAHVRMAALNALDQLHARLALRTIPFDGCITGLQDFSRSLFSPPSSSFLFCLRLHLKR